METAATNTPTPRWPRALLFVGLFIGLWTGLFRGCAALCDIKTHPAWTAADGGSPPPYFSVLAFPATQSVALYDKPDGKRVGTLDRAVMLSLDEDRGDWAG